MLCPLDKKLNDFLSNYQYYPEFKGNLRPQDWIRYYDFIVAAYSVPQGKRTTVSQLANIFETKNIPNPGSIAMLYAHGLYILARFDNLPIFKGGFNY